MEPPPRPHIFIWIPRERDIHVLPKSVNGIYPDIQGNVCIILMQIPFRVKNYIKFVLKL